MYRLLYCLLFIALFSCHDTDTKHAESTVPATDNTPPLINYRVLNAYPHDTSAYTEGLVVHDGQLFESTGTSADMPATRRSMFGIVDLKTGHIDKKAEIDRSVYFGEGITFLNGKWYQLTWTTKKGFIYDGKTYKKIGEFTIPMEQGWGMTTDGKSLIMSDGSSNISFVDPANFHVQRIISVTDNNGPVGNINELEYINGLLYANVYQTNYILRIDPATGKVNGRADLGSLQHEAEAKYPDVDVLNGIAYDSAKQQVFVTGKLWPSIYAISFTN